MFFIIYALYFYFVYYFILNFKYAYYFSDRMSGGQNEGMSIHSETLLTPIGTPSPRKLKIHSNPIFTM